MFFEPRDYLRHILASVTAEAFTGEETAAHGFSRGNKFRRGGLAECIVMARTTEP